MPLEEGGRLRLLRQNHVGDGLLLARDKEDGMITDELREWGSRWEDAVAREVSEIADRIDEQHKAALEKLSALIDEDTDQYLEGYNEASDFFASEIEDLRHRVGIIERKLNHRGER